MREHLAFHIGKRRVAAEGAIAMTDEQRLSTGSVVRRTVAPGRSRPGVGVVWLDRLALVGGEYRPHRPEAMVAGSDDAGAVVPGDVVSATVEVPCGYLVVDVRVGYGAAAAAFLAEVRVVDLRGHRKSALAFLERAHDCDPARRDDDATTVFVDASAAPPWRRAFVCVQATVVDYADHVAVRDLLAHLMRG